MNKSERRADLEELVQTLSPDTRRNLKYLLEFGTGYLGCEDLALVEAPDRHDESLGYSRLHPIPNTKKYLRVRGFQTNPCEKKLKIFLQLLALNDSRENCCTNFDKLKEYSEALFEGCPDSIVVTNERGVISDANRAMVALTRISRDKLIGMQVARLTDSHGRMEIAESLRKLASQGRVFFECNLYVKPQRRIPVAVSVRDFHFQGRRLVLATLRDMRSERDEISASETYQSSIQRCITNADDCFLRYDQFGRISDCNPHTRKLTGFSPSWLQGRPFDDLLSLNSLKKFRQAVTRLQKTGYATFNGEVMHANGKPVPVRATIMQLEFNGEHFCRVLLQDLREEE
ncbi:PAS domain-containing protein [Roseibacillus ishigakijimensis]|uniref:PAS domain S-box protein n=1 Tax=Roseibacillus ishigakijimensis TaxID=454146 RepID=A0A934RRY1_9BACT|nr:PAS domain-containing protein [Roseibacillus ishigakijimensis]MBK1834822.1 PAS domain S-box protein [Roseibacillus ishigakijimensis]